jgi:hypothetical protein
LQDHNNQVAAHQRGTAKRLTAARGRAYRAFTWLNEG